MAKIGIERESLVVEGHVLDVSKKPLLEAIRRYDSQLYLKWNPKKRNKRGCWELRRKPEFKSIKEGRFLDTPKGRIFYPGDVYEFNGFTLAVPKYNENDVENHVKDFDYLTYDILSWVSDHDLFKYGFRGKNAVKEAEYNEAKFDEKIEESAHEERLYMLKQERSNIKYFREYVLSGGNPYRLIDYWGK